MTSSSDFQSVNKKLFKAIGLMSGTSMDGVDLALIESDGQNLIKTLGSSYLPYGDNFKARLKTLTQKIPQLIATLGSSFVNDEANFKWHLACIKSNSSLLAEVELIENEITILHVELVNKFLDNKKISSQEVDFIGFHGQTIFHFPQQKITWQIGNAQLLANKTNINVVADFRTEDVLRGGQGAPLVPIYHFHLFGLRTLPILILNIGGVSNVTYFSSKNESSIEAFDVCFGNAPLDDLVKEKFGKDFDDGGKIAKTGIVNNEVVNEVLRHKIFYQKPPKSFSRDDFLSKLELVKSLKPQDALATMIEIFAKVLIINLQFLNPHPKEILVCGGGRKNSAIMEAMQNELLLEGFKIAVMPVEEIGLDGDFIEAEAFAFLAIRRVLDLPNSFPKTTGVNLNNYSEGCSGGKIFLKNT